MRNNAMLALLLVSFTSLAQHRKFEWTSGYIFSLPQGAMGKNINNAHGFGFDLYHTPNESRFSFGIEMAANIYGHDKTRQTYTFSDGTTAPMDVTVSNNFLNLLLGGRYYLGSGSIRPFITGKAGYSFYNTNLSIYDPDDSDHCEPVDSEILEQDGSLVVSAGGGLRIDLLPEKNPGTLFLLLSSNYTSGGKINYMNVNAPNHNHTMHSSDVYARFINKQTQIVHEHHVGNVYTSTINMLDFRVGIMVKLSTCCRLCHIEN